MRTEQKEFLRLLESGRTITEAAKGIGRSRSIAWHWAKQEPEFAKRFNPYKGKPSAATEELFPAEKPTDAQHAPPSIAIRDMAMKRLIDEVRQNGPAAVLASAAILLCDNPMTTGNEVAVSTAPTAIAVIAKAAPDPTVTELRRAVTTALHAVFDVKSDDRPITATCKQIADMLHRHSGQTFGDPILVSDAVSNFCAHYFAKGRFKNGDKHAFSYLIPVPRKIAR